MGKEIDHKLIEKHKPTESPLRYTTVENTIDEWAEDPHGERKLRGVAQIYGIPQEKIEQVLEEGGMGAYLRSLAEGRMVSMVSTQILRPTPYFLASVITAAEAVKKGIPSAVMLLEYPEDRFTTRNSDKMEAFGVQRFTVGYDDTNGIPTPRTVSLNVQPWGIRDDEMGTIRKISKIGEAEGKRCDQIMISIKDIKGPWNNDVGTLGAALGIDFDLEQPISLTDFYRALWIRTIASLRERGYLPSEEKLPMCFINMKQAYTTIAAEASPPQIVQETLRMDTPEHILTGPLGVNNEEAKKILMQEHGFEEYLSTKGVKHQNGLLVGMDGMPISASYYPAQLVWPHMYIECSSCGGEQFTNNLERAQKVRDLYGLPDGEVHNPHTEVPELEQYLVHPTGIYFNGRKRDYTDEESKTTQALRQKISELQTHMKKANHAQRAEINQQIQGLSAQIREVQSAVLAEYMERIAHKNGPDYERSTNLGLPVEVVQVYYQFAQGVDNALKDEKVQKHLYNLYTHI
ncbi:hypothetical protein HGA88_05680 [Candidatus Roizmanbacteria bacterium]|nr:hypothetical protein [Candidatus Roizmanbacteria bacterium]